MFVLILSVIASDYYRSKQFANYFRQNRIEVGFYFDQRSHDLSNEISDAEKNDFKTWSTKRKKERIDPVGLNDTKITTGSSFFLKALFKEVLTVNKSAKKFRQILKKAGISHVAFPLNIVGYNIPLYSKICRKNNVTTVCFPFAIGEQDARLKNYSNFHQDLHLSGLRSKVYGWLFKKWVISSNSESYLIISIPKLLSFYFFRVRVKNPASNYAVFVDYLLLENEESFIHVKQETTSARNTAVVGSLSLDEIYRIYSNRENEYLEFCDQYSLDSHKRLMCIAVPPLVGFNQLKLSDIFNLMLPNDLNLKEWNVILSIHPRIKKVSGIKLPNKVAITRESADKIIPLSDLFISCFSSTARTAVICNVPTINYDLVNFDYELFKNYTEVIFVKEQKSYQGMINELQYKPEKLIKVKHKMQKGNPSFKDCFDGKSGERILKYFK